MKWGIMTELYRPNPGSSWHDDPEGPYIRCWSGRKFHLKDPSPGQWYLPDVARHAAGVRRYTGATDFSIGQHMIVGAWMAERFYPEERLLAARFLVHDAPEAMYGDMSSPLKSLCPDYRRVLTDAERSFEEAVNLTWLDDPKVKEVDTRMWLTERLIVMRDAIASGVSIEEDYSGPLEPFPLTTDELYEKFTPWHPAVVRGTYISEFHRLLPWVPW